MNSLKIHGYPFLIYLEKTGNKLILTAEIGHFNHKMVKNDVKWHNKNNK